MSKETCENEARELAHSVEPIDFGSTEAIKLVAGLLLKKEKEIEELNDVISGLELSGKVWKNRADDLQEKLKGKDKLIDLHDKTIKELLDEKYALEEKLKAVEKEFFDYKVRWSIADLTRHKDMAAKVKTLTEENKYLKSTQQTATNSDLESLCARMAEALAPFVNRLKECTENGFKYPNLPIAYFNDKEHMTAKLVLNKYHKTTGKKGCGE